MWHVQALAAAHDGRLDDAERDSRRAIDKLEELKEFTNRVR